MRSQLKSRVPPITPVRPIDTVGAGLVPAPTLGDIVGAFKSVTTRQYIMGVELLNSPQFPGRFWQRNYYEKVIRDRESIYRIRKYIAENHLRWFEDDDNPINFSAKR